mmetsp:Transcript_64647/g.187338  ORF Transcript_64647/g.187338 Transcript_64647/m.187338 type:complete len:356 (+) Transcript_64647:671-1738(+)
MRFRRRKSSTAASSMRMSWGSLDGRPPSGIALRIRLRRMALGLRPVTVPSCMTSTCTCGGESRKACAAVLSIPFRRRKSSMAPPSRRGASQAESRREGLSSQRDGLSSWGSRGGLGPSGIAFRIRLSTRALGLRPLTTPSCITSTCTFGGQSRNACAAVASIPFRRRKPSTSSSSNGRMSQEDPLEASCGGLGPSGIARRIRLSKMALGLRPVTVPSSITCTCTCDGASRKACPAVLSMPFRRRKSSMVSPSGGGASQQEPFQAGASSCGGICPSGVARRILLSKMALGLRPVTVPSSITCVCTCGAASRRACPAVWSMLFRRIKSSMASSSGGGASLGESLHEGLSSQRDGLSS